MTTDTTRPELTARLKGIRRALVIIIIVAFAVSAAIGIWLIISGGEAMTETTGKILGTTALIGGVSLTALCHLAIVGRAIRAVGFVGLAASLAFLITGLMLIWQPWNSSNYEYTTNVGKAFQLSIMAAIFLAQVNLLLLLSQRKHRAIQISLYVTFAAIVVVYAIVTLVTFNEEIAMNWPDLWRFIAVAAIIDALGTIVSPVLGLVLKSKEPAADETVRVNLTLTSDQVAALESAHPGMPLADAVLAVISAKK